MWQELREELHPKGLEIVTVALDTGGEGAVRKYVDRAQPTHPTLLDQAHLTDELFGVVNVPSGIWIDEHGTIVRPPEPAHAQHSELIDKLLARKDELDPDTRETLELAARINHEPDKYVTAVRDWVEHGADSRYALSPDEVVERSRPRPEEEARAAACFELGQHLHRSGRPDDAVPWFREAHRLQPHNWTYKRQAWSFVDPGQGPNDVYDSDWASDVRAIGPENYYPPLDM